MKYPIFVGPEEYLQFRQGSFFIGALKRWSEEKAINSCLNGLDIKTLCDAPCGPGRLFYLWHKKGFQFMAVDLSECMYTAAKEACVRLNFAGKVINGDIFHLKDSLKYIPNIVVCVRFAYYLEREERIELLQVLAEASSQYILIQYKTTETWKGGLNEQRRKAKDRLHFKQYCSDRQIMEEAQEAGLRLVKIVPISQLSDRVFVLLDKLNN